MLRQVVGEWLEILNQDGKPSPPLTTGQGIAEKIALQLALAIGDKSCRLI
jgi:hypothetical protein